MSSQQKSVAMLAANPAFASILSSGLEESSYRTTVFSSLPALSTFLRIAPVDVAVLNLDTTWAETVSIVRALKAMPRLANPLVDVIVLAHAVPLVHSLEGTGIASLLVKPVTPAQLAHAISTLLEAIPDVRRAAPRHVPASLRTATGPARMPVTRQGNVIPLFGYRPTP